MINKKKLVLTTLLEVIFTALLIILLVFIREGSLNYLNEIQSYSQDLGLTQDMLSQNLTSYNKDQLALTINNFDAVLDKALLLLKIILPISIFILAFIFYFIIWKITTNVSLKRFAQYSIIPLISLLSTIFFLLNYIAYKSFLIEESPALQLTISGVLLIITYNIFLFGVSNKKSFLENLKLCNKNFFRFVLMLVVNTVYLLLVFYIFFLTFAGAPIIKITIILLTIIVIINFQRENMVRRIYELS